jgi:hypothetical protein
MRLMAWTMPAALAIAAIAYSVSLYSIEAAKQEAFMMKVCISAGGEWLKYWNNKSYCSRPNPPHT